jgi:hypothetical protein
VQQFEGAVNHVTTVPTRADMPSFKEQPPSLSSRSAS